MTTGSTMSPGPGDLELSEPRVSLTPYREQAVCVRRACKQYGWKSNACIVLDKLNMTVPKGAIYGLLGASGCGKTTLLGCILGRRMLNSGEIWVLGGKPGTRGSGVPGPRVGYMPQEVALYPEFSIRETMKYFGWINGLTTERIDERLEFLVNLLLLPSADQLVKHLSGGQQRRVSLMATLLHEPELLILDEPTVGVDPLIRHNIWKHLIDITKQNNTTVILTTHYIDEARQAELIGLMRGGYFLAEESPESLMSKHSGQTLEDVFLKLSVMQNMSKRQRADSLEIINNGTINQAAVLDDEVGEISGISVNNEAILTKPAETELPPDKDPSISFCDRLKVVQMKHMHALMWKNFVWMLRNISITLFVTILPAIQCALFCICIGHEPTGLPISVVNYELDMAESCKPVLECNSTRLSCNYLTYLEKRTLQLSYYPTEEEGKVPVRQGKAWATIIFPHNFSDAMQQRIRKGINVEKWDLTSSTVNVYQDKSNEHIGSYIQLDLFLAFQDFFKEFLTSCNVTNRLAELPLKLEKPVYGVIGTDFTDFISPGVIITMIFFLAVALSAGAILLDRKEGMLERTIVNGISSSELLLAHLITCWLVMFFQAAALLIFCFPIFGLTQNGSYGVVIALVLLTGLCGMCFGFLVACFCKDELSGAYLGMGTFFPLVVLCGIFWPMEAMHQILQVIAYVLPLTKSTHSLRCVLSRGWGIDSPDVYAGFISNAIWIVIFLGVSLCMLRFKKG